MPQIFINYQSSALSIGQEQNAHLFSWAKNIF